MQLSFCRWWICYMIKPRTVLSFIADLLPKHCLGSLCGTDTKPVHYRASQSFSNCEEDSGERVFQVCPDSIKTVLICANREKRPFAKSFVLEQILNLFLWPQEIRSIFVSLCQTKSVSLHNPRLEYTSWTKLWS